ncbi:Frag1/DRAM/Sfk1 family-containing protein [Strongyloides ratti]|uniref:Frag1/DRAM/Sfk1 family-containing protein n=1 Tax=Strongyloides ratti TaxID=34506 RepID=A0A090LHP0_STRRB|nr:Frag1/DRAM/Sfk1 family-containing protein [Strongyloides ratti]CEF69237.1 Frag1/DRAM/Sfk1 family-containing protein [Strongyloides ratti]
MVKILRMGRIGAAHIPISFGILLSATLGITYCLSVYNHDVDYWLPYISSSGDARPESCIFSFLLNISAVLCLLNLYLRYMLVAQLNRELDVFLKIINRIAFTMGVIAGVSMLIVANFQQTAQWTIHITAAVICFTSAVIYMCIDSFVTMYMYPTYNNKKIALIRIGIASAGVISLILAISFGFAASIKFHSVYPDEDIPRPWSNRKYYTPGYGLHCVSAFFEWLLALIIMFYIISFSRDFESIHVKLTVEALVSHLDHEVIWASSDDLTRSH